MAGRAALALAALGAGGLAYAHLETKLFTLRRVTVPVLAPGSPEIRALHIADLHLTPGQRRKTDWLRSLAQLRPDVVFDTGDNIAHADALPVLLDAMEPLLAASQGAFVMGSNDYYAPTPKNPARYLRKDARDAAEPAAELPTAELAAAFSAHGWLDLTNARRRLVVHDVTFDLVGVDDPHMERDAYPRRGDTAGGDGNDARSGSGGSSATAGRDRRDADPAANATAADPTVVRVGVVHAPYLRVLDEMRSDGVELVIAGHTHGGQLRVPGFGALVTNCDLDRGRASGLHGWPGPRPDEVGGEDSLWLHVSAGAGTSPYAPVRFACRPEATLLTLVGRRR